MKVTGMFVGKLKLNPKEKPMWVWLNLKPTPKGDNTQTGMTARVCRVLF